MKKLFVFQCLALILACIIAVPGCKKENIPPKALVSKVDNIDGRQIRYTILVVPAENLSKSASALDTTIVTLVMNDSIYYRQADKSGFVTFNNLSSGLAAVTIKSKNRTTANMIVDLHAQPDSAYDSKNIRNASTIVVLFPTLGKGTATLKGLATAELDLTNATREIAPSGIVVSVAICNDQLLNYVNHTGEGQIVSISHDNATILTAIGSDGRYEIAVPAAARGLKLIVRASDFEFNQKITATESQRKVFSSKTDTVMVISGLTKFKDIIFGY